MRFEDNDDEELVFYNEAEEPETNDIAEDADEDEFTRPVGNPFISQAEIDALLDGDDSDAMSLLKERRYKDRIKRRKTGRSVGNFKFDLLAALTFSPSRFVAELKTFLDYVRLGQYREDEEGNLPDEAECDQLYQAKKVIFWHTVTKQSFLWPAIFEILILLMAVFGFKSGMSQLMRSFGLFRLFMVIAALIAGWVSFKSILRSVISVMRTTHDAVIDKKKDADKAKKAQLAQQEARRKAQEKERKEAMRRQAPAPTEENHSEEPIRPSGRGRYRRSGG
jgi:hypothetical protein